MKRSNFLKSALFVPAMVSGHNGFFQAAGESSGIRVLGADRSFTLWKPEMDPAYHVGLNEVVLVETSHGMPGLVTRDGVFREPGPESVINPQTGPIFVDGIEPGDMLAIDILDISVGDWGYCSGQIFELKDGYVIFSRSLKLPMMPMLGSIGISPSEGTLDTKAPGETGGNMDCREVRSGSTVVFKARVKGALAGMGDAHALQGDGEVTGQGVETDAKAIVRFRKLTGFSCDRPVIIRNDSVSTVGAHRDLEEAAWQATDDMVKLVQQMTGRNDKESYLLVSLTGMLKINQIVDPAKGARMEVPAWVFGI